MKKSKYYRKITESLPQPLKKKAKKAVAYVKPGLKSENLIYHWTRFFILFLVLTFIFMSYVAGQIYIKGIELKEKHANTVGELVYWEGVVRDHPNFPDALYNAAIFSYQIGDDGKAIKYVDRAIKLDPDFTDAVEFRKKLE